MSGQLSAMDAGVAFLVFLAVLAVCCWVADTIDERYQRFLDLQRMRLTRTTSKQSTTPEEGR